MRNKGIGLGVFLVSIGIVWGLVALKIINLSVFTSIFTLWPLIIVVIGINMIFRNKYAIRILSWLIFLTVIIVYGYYNDRGWTAENGNTPGMSGNLSIQSEPGTTGAELILKLGGMKFDLDSGTTKLLDFETNDKYVHHTIDKDGNKSIITFSKQEYDLFNWGNKSSISSFHLNPDLPWDMVLNIGAVEGKLDLSGIRTDKLDIKTGAADLKLVLGNKSPDCKVNIKAGAAQIKLTLPKEAGVKVTVKGGLSNTNLNGLDWNKDGSTYTSPNFNSAGNKIEITYSAGVCDLDIITQ